MADKEFLKRLNEKIDKLKVINIQDNPDYYLSIRLLTKGFFNECIRDKQGVINYVRGYSFSFILDEHGAPRTDDMAIKNSIDLGYFLIFAADKYGAGFVLEELFEKSVVKKYSKLNPINWFLWIFNKIVWSEIKVRPELESNESFCRAIKRFQNLKSDSTINLFTDPMLYEDLMIIIQKIAEEVGHKEALKIGESKQVPELAASAAVNTRSNPLPAFPPVANLSSNQPSEIVVGCKEVETSDEPEPAAAGSPPPPPPPMPEAPAVGDPSLTSLPPPSGHLEAIRNANIHKIKEAKGSKLKLPGKQKVDPKPKPKSLADAMRENMDKRYPAIHGDDSDSDSDPDDWDDDSDNESVKVVKKSSSSADEVLISGASAKETPAPQSQDDSVSGVPRASTRGQKPPIPPKPRVEKKSVDTDALNKDSGISGGAESSDQPSSVSVVSVAALITGVGMFADSSAGINNPQPSQSGATPTMVS